MHHWRVLFNVCTDIYSALNAATAPTLSAIRATPSLLWKPAQLSRTFMAHVWAVWGDGVDNMSREIKEDLVRSRARGVVLDIGAGHGHLVPYLDRSRVTAYVALEPNVLMHAHLREAGNAAGFSEEDGTLLLLPYGAEETDNIEAALVRLRSSVSLTGSTSGHAAAQGRVDTLVSILSFCSVPSPERTIKELVARILAPGGQLLFYEHVRNPLKDVQWWQRVYAPLWRTFFDGCVVGQDTVKYIRDAPGEAGWKDVTLWGKEGEDVQSLFWHQVGVCVKRDVERIF